MTTNRVPLGFLAIASLALLATPGCSTNPATGETQLALISEAQEIEMGREAAQEVEASIGTVNDEGLQDYVNRIGQRLAAQSERPDLPWSFKVVDDPNINAFALPGGFIYVTRGIMSAFNSEAELAAVLGHEIGHVTARHRVNRISQQQAFGGLATVGAAVFDLGSLARGALGTGLNLLFLEYSRDDERQADDLGLRYMIRGSYAPGEMLDVFETLERVDESASGGRTPNWLATHPSPGDRLERIARRMRNDTIGISASVVRREEYLRRIDGMVYGPNPRNGFLRGQLFMHPDLRFRLEFPAGWGTENMARAVVAGSPGEDALIRLTISSHSSADAAIEDFALLPGVSVGAGARSRTTINGLTARVTSFEAQSGEGQEPPLRGIAAFVEYGGNVYELLGYSLKSRYRAYESSFQNSIRSFDRLTDPEPLNVEPRRIGLVHIESPMTLREFWSRYGGSLDIETLSLVNGVTVDATLDVGTWKRVVSGG